MSDLPPMKPEHNPVAEPNPAGATDGTSSSRADDRPPLRVATIVWGAILIAVGIGIIAIAAGATIDVELALIVGLAVAGLALVIGSTIASMRRRK